MQFHHPHHFRQQVADALQAEMPEVWRGLLAAGAVPAVLPGQPGVAGFMAGDLLVMRTPYGSG